MRQHCRPRAFAQAILTFSFFVFAIPYSVQDGLFDFQIVDNHNLDVPSRIAFNPKGPPDFGSLAQTNFGVLNLFDYHTPGPGPSTGNAPVVEAIFQLSVDPSSFTPSDSGPANNPCQAYAYTATTTMNLQEESPGQYFTYPINFYVVASLGYLAANPGCL